MAVKTASRVIGAPKDLVFRAISEVESFTEAVPDIKKIEFLSESRKGLGTRFRETRMMGKREATTVLEITEYVENDRIRYVSDAGGTIWDTVYTVSSTAGGTTLTLAMEDRPHKFIARLVNPLIRGMVGKAIEADMDRVKTWSEAQG